MKNPDSDKEYLYLVKKKEREAMLWYKEWGCLSRYLRKGSFEQQIGMERDDLRACLQMSGRMQVLCEGVGFGEWKTWNVSFGDPWERENTA